MWRLNIIESERGWGQRIDEVMTFDSLEAAEKYKAEYNSANKLDYVPDWYMYAAGPYKE